MKYRCCPTGEKIHIESDQTVSCKNIDCPPPTAIQDYVFYSDTAKAGRPANEFLVSHSNCKIKCKSSYRWNAEDSNCALYESCPSLYELQESNIDKGLYIYKLEQQSPNFDCAEAGDYYEKLSSRSCIQDVDSVTKDTFQYCCPSGFTYDRVKNDCMQTYTVCLDDTPEIVPLS